MSIIYKATCKDTGKSYIGWTPDLEKRKRLHRYKANSGQPQHFMRAIRKHGFDSFEWEILFESNDDEYVKNIMEPYFIEKYDTFNNGYNSTKGGDGAVGYHHTEEHKRYMSEKLKGVNVGKPGPMLGRKNEGASKAAKLRTGTNNPNFGKTHPSWVESCKKRAKTWKLIDPDGNEIIVTNLAAFCKERGFHMGNFVSVAKGRLNHYKKWKCFYLEPGGD